jgi:quercetin dioxygenase-like cupin family protein
MKEVVNLTNEATSLVDHWSPRIVARVNDQYVKVARLKGEFTWHSHDEEDELFLVLRGQLVIQYEDRDDVQLAAGEMHVVPKGIIHNPVAAEDCWIALIETVTTLHTGNVVDAKSKSIDEQLEAGDFTEQVD